MPVLQNVCEVEHLATFVIKILAIFQKTHLLKRILNVEKDMRMSGGSILDNAVNTVNPGRI